jgi:hypothetical protein
MLKMAASEIADIADFYYRHTPAFSLITKQHSAILLNLCGINFSCGDLISVEVVVWEIYTGKLPTMCKSRSDVFSDLNLFI